jgi:acyl carrier protein
MVPTYFVPIDAVPMTPNGKTDYKALEKEFDSRNRTGEYIPPATQMEKRLAEIWQDIFRLQPETVSAHADFFELGGHSIKAVHLISSIQKAFNVKILLTQIFRFPTLRELAVQVEEAVSQGGGEGFQSIPRAPKQEFYPLSSAQKRLYILQQMDKQSAVYNMPMAVRIRGPLSKEQAQTALNGLIQRHETLRTAFVTREKVAVQYIHDKAMACPFEYSESVQSEEEVEGLIQSFIRPFDLSQAPLIRACLIRLEDREHILALDMHHTVSDGVTTDIVIDDFLALYQGKTLEPLPLQYKDYSHWQNRLLESEEIDKQRLFWLKRFRGALPELDIPTDFPRPAVRGSEGAIAGTQLDAQLSQAVKSALLETNTTLYQYLLAVYFVLLHKYGGQTDIVVGSPVSGRQHMELYKIAGVFVNMVAIRTRPMAEKTFKEFLEEVKHAAIAAHENQDYPFDELVNRLGLRGGTGRNPIFDAGFLYYRPDNTASDKNPIEGLTIEPYETQGKVSRFDMLMSITENEDRISVNVEYSTQLFKAGSIEVFLGHYTDIVRQVVHSPEIPLDQVTVASHLQAIEAEEPEITFGF